MKLAKKLTKKLRKRHRSKLEGFMNSLVLFLKKYSVVVSVCILVVVLSVVYLLVIGLKPSFVIVPNKIIIEQGNNLRLKALFDPDGRFGLKKEMNVTNETSWSSSDESVFLIGTHQENIGEVFPIKLGTASVRAVYKNIHIVVPVEVKGAKLAAKCMPTRGTKIHSGEEVDYIALYSQKGVADYRYIWKAPEDQTSKDIIPRFIFQLPGTKIVKTIITDYVGNVIDIECVPLEVLP